MKKIHITKIIVDRELLIKILSVLYNLFDTDLNFELITVL